MNVLFGIIKNIIYDINNAKSNYKVHNWEAMLPICNR